MLSPAGGNPRGFQAPLRRAGLPRRRLRRYRERRGVRAAEGAPQGEYLFTLFSQEDIDIIY